MSTNATQIISLFGTLGLGGLIGILVKSFLDRKISDKRMLFEARLEAYSGITGRIHNNFLEPDITSLQEPLRWVKFNQLLSEAILLSGPKLSKMFNDYEVVLYEFHCALNKKPDEIQEKLHAQVVDFAERIINEMRKELYVK